MVVMVSCYQRVCGSTGTSARGAHESPLCALATNVPSDLCANKATIVTLEGLTPVSTQDSNTRAHCTNSPHLTNMQITSTHSSLKIQAPKIQLVPKTPNSLPIFTLPWMSSNSVNHIHIQYVHIFTVYLFLEF